MKFYWGSATAAYQVEGGIENTDWNEAARQGKVPVCGKAADHYNRFESDFALASNLGHNAHRISIEWARIEPRPGFFDQKELAHYKEVIASMKRHNLEPFVTLWHFTLPLWLSTMGGFENPKAIAFFSRYVSTVVNAIPEVNFWITINEPMVYVSNSYQRGKWPPFKKSFLKTQKVISNLIKAHKAAYEEIKKIKPQVSIGIAKNNMAIYRGGSWPVSILYGIAGAIFNWYWNEGFLNNIKNYSDFIGLNYYMQVYFMKAAQKPKRMRNDLGWTIDAHGFYLLLKHLQRYNKPIYVTENGLADKTDTLRPQFIKEHVQALWQAKKEGVQVHGYLHWSLMDNYEWAEGFNPRFGLIEINYDTMERIIRPSAQVYKQIIHDHLDSAGSSSTNN